MDFVKIKGTEFVFKNKKVMFRGLGIGTWLNLEHFMLGIPTPEKQIKQAFGEVFGKDKSKDFFEDFVFSFCNESDFKFLKETGINVVRVPFNHRLFIDENSIECWKDEGFKYFDYLFELCSKYEIFILPDLHTTPGGQNPDWHSDNQTGYPQFWEFSIFQTQIVELWQKFADRYKNEQYLLGYDILNEPFIMEEKENKLQNFYDRVTEAIRKVDNNHIIFLEGDFFAMDFSEVKEIKDEQTAITFHFYPTVWEKDLCDIDYPCEKRREIFESRFDTMVDKMKVFGRPLLCGEAGYSIADNNLAHVMDMVEDTLDLFDKKGVSWTLWCYKDANFMGLVYPKKDCLWLQFSKEIYEDWTHYKEMDMGEKYINDISKDFKGEVSDELKYHLQFRQRAILFSLQKEQILRPLLEKWGYDKIKDLPKSFLFENCGYYDDYRKLIKKYTDK